MVSGTLSGNGRVHRVQLFNVLEVITVKARHRHALALAGLLAGVAAGGVPAALEAQTTRTADPNAPRMMVPPLRSQDKGLGVQAADAIRSRLNQDIPTKNLWQIPKNDIVGTLEASGYKPDEALAPNDARELGKLLRADEYLQGTVTKAGNGFKIESQLVLVRDNSLVQPLPPVQGGRLNEAATLLSKEVQAARKQLPAEQKCVALARENKFAEAIQAAQAGVAAYPRSTLARACMASAMVAMKAPSDSILKFTSEILAIDPKNRPALTIAAQAYADAAKAATDSAQKVQLQNKTVETLTGLLATDPTNARLVDDVVRRIATSANPRVALPIITQAVQQNPGDPQLLRLQWRLQLAAKDTKAAIQTGEQMVQLDTAMADTLYFIGLAGAYATDSQPQKAAEAYARGVQKFPNNASLQLGYAQQLSKAGQSQQAIAALQKALQLNPKAENGYVILAQIYDDAGQTDSAVAALRQAAANKDTLAGPVALAIGNKIYKRANTSKNPDEFNKAVQVLTFADSLATAPLTKAQAKFLTGVSQLNLGQIYLTQAREKKSCDLANQANENLVSAQINIPPGGQFAKDAAAAAMGALQQLAPYGEQMQKALCKGKRRG